MSIQDFSIRNLSDAEQRHAARQFMNNWAGRGYEKGESSTFWLDLLSNVYGVVNVGNYIKFEEQVKLDHTSFIDGHIPATHVLIEQKSIHKDLLTPIRQSDGSFLTPFQQAKKYSSEIPYSQRPRWIVTCNFKEFNIYDMEKPQDEPEILYLENLEDEYYRLNFLINIKDDNIFKQEEISIKAGDIIGKLYNSFLEEYNNPNDKNTLHSLNVLCVRLVFCLYAEDAGLFGHKNKFHDYLGQYSAKDARRSLIDLFRVLNTPENMRDPYLDDDLASFPYVNGGLFADSSIEIPRLNEKILDIILNQASRNFDWSEISPTIFGSLFESTLNPEIRATGGMHYTSIENIHKVIDPLFLNDIANEFERIKAFKSENSRTRGLKNLQEKIASLKFMDPACGSGNFLTESYIALRKIENQIIRLLQKDKQIVMDVYDNPIKVSINQFYGIEINDYAVSVAKTALWIAESQMLKETEDIIASSIDFLPLKGDVHIYHENALRVDWNEIVPNSELNYIMGNPPFLGARLMTAEQKEDINIIFSDFKNRGNLDYVTCWFKKASDYIQGTSIEVAFVSTSSITEGEQVELLWKPLMERHGIFINFAYRSFKWNSEANNKAQVFVVIIGFSTKERDNKIIYTSDNIISANNINPYIVDAPNVFITGRSKPLFDVPNIGIGNKPIDDGNYLFTKTEMYDFLDKEPNSSKFFRKWYGAREFINREPRYCLWLGYANPTELRTMPHVLERISNVKNFRSESKSAGTRKLANTPTRFHVENIPDSDYILIPSTSSEKRYYIPIGFMDKKSLSSNAVHIIPDGNIFHFGILTSSVHMGWMRTVAGRLKSDYRYSKDIVYNNFPWPEVSESQKTKIEATAQAILAARDLYPEASLADLYDDLVMPIELRKAHQANDKAVMEAYGFDPNMTEAEIVAELMNLYVAITSGNN